MTQQFKVGDTVKVIGLGTHSSYSGVTLGMTGTVMVQKSSVTGNVGVKFEEPIEGNCLYENYASTLKGDDAQKGLWIEPENLELIEESKMTQQFKNMKIRIKDEQHSRLVQETLFSMGYGWSDQAVRHTTSPWLTTYKDGRIYYGTTAIDFNSHANEEVELITTYSIKPVDQEAKRKREEKEALEKGIADLQKQLDEMKQKLENM